MGRRIGHFEVIRYQDDVLYGYVEDWSANVPLGVAYGSERFVGLFG